MTASVGHPRPADSPAGMLPGTGLGRTINLDRALREFGAVRVHQMTDAYVRGDEVGYHAWKSLREVDGPPGAGKRMLNQAVEKGIDSVVDPPAAMMALFDEIDNVPSWVDPEQLRRGAIAYWRAGRLVPASLVYNGYGAGLRYGGTRPTLFSRRLLDQESAGRRLRETIRWVVVATTPGSMHRFGPGMELTLRVRMIHAAVRDFISKSPHWRWDDWGLPINSADGLYQGGGLFCAAVVDGLGKLGVRFDARERDDMFALWRYLNHVMGVPSDLNYTDEADMRAKMAVSEMLEPAPDGDCGLMMNAMIDYVCEEFDQYHIIPELIDTRLSVAQKKYMTYGACRALLGDAVCDDFAIPPSRVSSLVSVARVVVNAKEIVTRRRSPNDVAVAAATIAALGRALGIEVPDEDAVVDTDELRAQMARNHDKSAFIH